MNDNLRKELRSAHTDIASTEHRLTLAKRVLDRVFFVEQQRLKNIPTQFRKGPAFAQTEKEVNDLFTVSCELSNALTIVKVLAKNLGTITGE